MTDNGNFRRYWVFVHRWLGLTLGIALVVIGLTGSFAVYWREIDRIIRPELVVRDRAGDALNLDEILAIAKAAHPQRPKPWTLSQPYDEKSPVYANYSRPEERGLKYSTTLHVAINPYTGDIMSQWYWGETLASWIYDLHANFQAGIVGHRIIGIFGPILIVFSLLGLYVWWPVRGFARRHFFVEFRTGASRVELDLHRATGFYTLPLMIILGLTGYFFVFPHHVKMVVGSVWTLGVQTPTALHGGDETHGTTVAGSKQHDQHDTRYPRSIPQPGVTPLSVSQAVQRAQQEFPGAEVKSVYTPAGETGVYGVIMRHPKEPLSKTYPSTEVWLDQYDGRVIVKSDPRDNSVGQSLLDAALPLHNGEGGGEPGRALVFALGLMPLLMFVTGLLQWLRRRGWKH